MVAFLMNPVARILIFMGFVFILSGILWQLGGRFLGLGRLPGDIVIERGNFRFYFPWVTCLILSIVLTVLLSVFRGLGK